MDGRSFAPGHAILVQRYSSGNRYPLRGRLQRIWWVAYGRFICPGRLVSGDRLTRQFEVGTLWPGPEHHGYQRGVGRCTCRSGPQDGYDYGRPDYSDHRGET